MKKSYTALLALLALLISACANIGSPDGGMFDETPPVVVSTSPLNGAVHNNKKKITILFNEYIRLENANEKVMISPPQMEMANVRAEGKRIKVDLYDTLQANTTYTIDFGDAIEDNNERNPMGFYTFTFSTGDVIDTMQVAGWVVNAEDLEPVKGLLVGVYPADSTYNDSLFRTSPLTRISRTNGEGKFEVKGIRPGSYRVFALEDKDGDMRFTQKSERIAFDTTIYTVSCRPDVRYDTIWHDSLHYDSIRVMPYTHYFPDDVVLRVFLEGGQEHHLLKTERPDPYQFRIFFTAPSDSLPTIRGLNFDEKCLTLTPSLHNDTLTYWVTDTTYSCLQDTLSFELTYLDTDTAGILQSRTDTLDLVPKLTYKRIHEEQLEKMEKWEKNRAKQAKRAKKPLPYARNPYSFTPLDFSVSPSGGLNPNENVTLRAREPILRVDSSRVHFTIKQDSNWIPEPYLFLPVENDAYAYRLYAEWESDKTYRLEVDSAAIVSVLGNASKSIKQEFKVRGSKDFGSIFIHVIDADTGIVVQLLDRGAKVKAQQRADKDGRADFFYLRAGNYYLRAFIDRNGNNIWDTGDYGTGLQPEEVFYFPKPINLRAQWDVEQDWEIRGIPIMEQKPREMVKQKGDKKKKQTAHQRNIQRQMLKNKR